jgi:hypothetical protein
MACRAVIDPHASWGSATRSLFWVFFWHRSDQIRSHGLSSAWISRESQRAMKGFPFFPFFFFFLPFSSLYSFLTMDDGQMAVDPTASGPLPDPPVHSAIFFFKSN